MGLIELFWIFFSTKGRSEQKSQVDTNNDGRYRAEVQPFKFVASDMHHHWWGARLKNNKTIDELFADKTINQNKIKQTKQIPFEFHGYQSESGRSSRQE
jgi:hypothetical protein